ncbi:MAG TPA: hypothetical protein VE378_04525 [Nitrososphaeraceae archaeon]|nr:hypothetical protein [Nitrososphaeraceae archaeon]
MESNIVFSSSKYLEDDTGASTKAAAATVAATQSWFSDLVKAIDV